MANVPDHRELRTRNGASEISTDLATGFVIRSCEHERWNS